MVAFYGFEAGHNTLNILLLGSCTNGGCKSMFKLVFKAAIRYTPVFLVTFFPLWSLFMGQALAATQVTTVGYDWDGTTLETVKWSVSDNLELLAPWGNHCQTYKTSIDTTVVCTYEANFNPPIGGNTSVWATITPSVRWHADSFKIDYGQSESMDSCAPTGICRPCDPSTGMYCDYLQPYTYDMSHTSNLWSWYFSGVNEWSKGYGFKIRYFRYRLPIYNEGITRAWFTMEIHIKPSDEQLAIFRKNEGAGPPKKDDWGYPFDGSAGRQPPPPRPPKEPGPMETDDESPDEEPGAGPGPCGMGLPDFWVNTANLNVAVKDTVFAYESLGPDISMTHYYNAIPGLEGMFGKGWTFNYESVLTASPYEGAYLRLGTGRGITYRTPLYGSGGVVIDPPFDYLNPTGVGDTLTDYNGYLIWHSATSGWDYRYQSVAGTLRLVSISDKNQNALSVNYNGSGDIINITDAAGRITSFGYNSQGLCSSMTAPDGRLAHYTYDSLGRLITSIDLMDIVTTYTYDDDHYLTSITVGGKTALIHLAQ
jgi:YD repeat-containing protein